MYIRSLPDNQGWISGGYRFYVADDGTLTYGRPGDPAQPLIPPITDGSDFALEYTVMINGGESLPGQISFYGSNNIGSTDLIVGFDVNFQSLNAVTPDNADYTWRQIGQGAILILNGATAWAIYQLNSKVRDYATFCYYFDSISILDASGNFIQGETLRLQFINTAEPFYFQLNGNGLRILEPLPYRYHVNCSGGNLTLTLPLASAALYQVLQFKRIDTTSNTVTIQRSGSDLIDGEIIQTIGQWESISLHSDSISNWYIS